MVQNEQISRIDYTIHNKLLTHLEDRLHIEQKLEKLTSAGEELSAEDKKTRKRLIDKKVRILDKYVFQSMANVTVFLEYCMRHPELQKVFDDNDDIQELLLGIHEDYYYDKESKEYKKRYSGEDQTVIGRFITAILSWDSKNNPNNFRLLLFPIIQRAIRHTIMGIVDDLLGVRMSNSIVLNDFGRVEILTEFLGKNIKIKTDMPHRPVKF